MLVDMSLVTMLCSSTAAAVDVRPRRQGLCPSPCRRILFSAQTTTYRECRARDANDTRSVTGAKRAAITQLLSAAMRNMILPRTHFIDDIRFTREVPCR